MTVLLADARLIVLKERLYVPTSQSTRISSVIEKVLKRDWKNNPSGEKITVENRKDEILYKLARIARNTDAIHPSTSGPQVGSLLLKLRWLDIEKYDKEVIGL